MRGLAGPPPRPESFFSLVVRQAAPYIGVAWTLTAAVLLGVLGGWWLDRRFGTGPVLLIAGTVAGLVVGMYELARITLRRGGPRGPEERG